MAAQPGGDERNDGGDRKDILSTARGFVLLTRVVFFTAVNRAAAMFMRRTRTHFLWEALD